MELIPDRAHYRPGQSIRLECVPPPEYDATLTVTRLQAVVETRIVPAGTSWIDVRPLPVGGYGASLGSVATAFDVSQSPFQRPRYGFVARMAEDVEERAVSAAFRRLHLSLAQFYDWAYRHSRLLPPADSYVDPLGQPRDLPSVNRLAEALENAGTIPLGYSAVYAVSYDELDEWEHAVLRTPDGEPYRLGDDFLVILDPVDSRWLSHYLSELEKALNGTALRGFHLDQYGWPKFGTRADGTRVDLAAAFPAMLTAVRERLPEAALAFNNVNDFPTYATATAPQDATYIEVWDPHSSLRDLAILAAKARRMRPEHPPILAAYLSCYTGDEHRANLAAAFVMATAFSHGATHLLLGESGNVLTGPYYPQNHALRDKSLEFFRRWYDVQVRYGDLLFDPHLEDVTEFFCGGTNQDVVFSGANGVAFSTTPTPGTVWMRVVRTTSGLVVHLINLVGQRSTDWDSEKEEPVHQTGLEMSLAFSYPSAQVYAVTVGSADPAMVPLSPCEPISEAKGDLLSAAQSGTRYRLPDLGLWSIVFIPADAYL